MERISLLRLFTLKELHREPHSGYELLDALAQYNGGKKPSTGTLYPLLQDLHKKGMISYKTVGRKKIYSITASGKRRIQKLEKDQKELMQKKAELIRGLESLSAKKRSNKNILPEQMFDNPWFKYNINAWSELDKEMRILLSKPFDERKAKKWSKELERHTQFIRKLNNSAGTHK